MSEQTLVRAKDTYKEAISIIKDTLDVAWKLAPLALLPAALFLWVYLRSIHWTSIFQESATSSAGLIFLIVAAMLIAFAVLLQFIVPSMLLIGTMWYYRQDSTIPKTVPRLYRWATCGWLAGFAIVIALDSSKIWIIFASAFVPALTYALIQRKTLGAQVEPGASRHGAWIYAFGLALSALATMTATSIPLLVALNAAAQYVGGSWQEKLLGFFVCLGTTFASLLPGYMYLNARTWNAGLYRPLKLALLGVFFLSYIVFSIAAFFTPVSSTVLRLTGVYSNEPQSFQVLQPSLAAALAAAELPMQEDKKMTVVTGYVRYGFGGVRLLCRQPFDPALVSDDAIKVARKNKALDPTIIAGTACVLASSQELRPLRI